MAIIYGLKVNLSVAMVAMLNHTLLASQTDGTSPANHTISTEPECEGSEGGEVIEVMTQTPLINKNRLQKFHCQLICVD